MSSLRLILRSLAKSPLFAIVAVTSLALGIGANTAMFSLIDQILLRKLPVKNPQELAFLYHPGPLEGSISTDEPDSPSFSYPLFRELQKSQTPFSGLFASHQTTASISYQNQAISGAALLVSGNYFDTLGIRPVMGRLFTEEDDRTPGGHPVAVLSHGYWMSRFSGDVGMLNQSITINGYPMTIVGVAAPGFLGERLGSSPEVFVPITMKQVMTPGWDGLTDRKNAWMTMGARLKPGMTLERAAMEINVAYRVQLEQDEKLLGRPSPDFLRRFRAKKIVLKPGEQGRGTFVGRSRQPILLLSAMTLMVLLIACANVANLQLARAAARTKEMAVRLAMGASRLQLIGHLLAESCILAVVGGAAGLGVGYATLRTLLSLVPDARDAALTPGMNGPLLLFCLALSLLTGVLFGLFPALQASKPDIAPTLKDQAGQTTSSGSANLFRKAMVTGQVAISLLLLIGAGLFLKTLSNLTKIDLGMQVDHLISFSLNPKLNRYTDERSRQFYEQLTERLNAIPGVRLVSAATTPAIAGSSSSGNITVEGFTPQTDDASDSHLNAVGPDYFRTMGIPLVAGREFTRTDNATAPKVAVVNEAFVRHFLPGQNPLGRRLTKGGGNVKLDTEIVGVVKDTKYTEMKESPKAILFTGYLQSPRQSSMYFYLRTSVDPESIVPIIRREVAALDGSLPIREFKTMETQIAENLYAERLLSIFTGSFAALATLLAGLGLYGVLAFNVARRTREIGIRMALGAQAGNVRRLVLQEIVLVLAIGLTAGLAGALAAGKLVESVLYQMKAFDLLVYAGATLLLGSIALAAAYLPARKATSIDPMVALRWE